MFKKPDAETIKRMSPIGIRSLLDSLKDRRRQMVAPIDKEIKFYEDLLQKKEGNNATTTGTVRAS